eukprot:11159898-Lingulodinium_polyedra.AAC.1
MGTDAVAVFPNRGAFPAMLASALAAADHIGFQVGVQGGAILLGRLMPDHVDGALEAIGAHRWARPVCPPVRPTAVAP